MIILLSLVTGDKSLFAFVWAILLILTKKLSDNQKPTTVASFFALIIIPLSFFLVLPFWQWPIGMEWLY